MKLLLLLLGANALVDGFSELNGVKFRDVPTKRDDHASERKVGEEDGSVGSAPAEKLELLGTTVTSIAIGEGNAARASR